MKKARDDFSLETKNTLAYRVGMKCSNPNCRQPTSGPQDDPKKAVNVGVASHITAASPKGPRYDKRLSTEDRMSIENGIWLCQNCGKLVDNDEKRYTADLLQHWKRLSEEAARLEVESPGVRIPATPIDDKDMVRFYAQCLDRPAFQDPFMQEGSIEAFDKAIEDTITAINTGCLRSRDGAVLAQSKGKAFLKNTRWRQKMDVVVDLLRAIRSRYDDAKRQGVIHTNSRPDMEWYCINDPELADWMDRTRGQVMDTFAVVCHEAGIPEMRFPRMLSRRRWGR